ncbi:MAG: hypothetical protein Q8N18_06030 [Opitutaceae bacterium]|nr:hypothetical protein [Opitutaceae bacterium]
MKPTHAPDPHELSEQEHAIRAKAAAEIAALTARRDAEQHRRAPLNNLIERRRLLLERIDRGRRGRQLQQVRAEIFASRADECFAHESESAIAGFHNLIAQDLTGFHAPRIIAELDRWLSARETELSDLESQILNLAAELRLEQLLPADLATQTTSSSPRE